MRLSEKKWEIGDVKGYNQVTDLVIQYTKERLRKDSSLVFRMGNNIAIYTKIDNNLKKGDPKVALESLLDMMNGFGSKINDSERGYFFDAFPKGCETAFLLEDRSTLEKLHTAAQIIKGGEYGELTSDVYIKLLDKDYDAALNRLLGIAENGGGFTGSKVSAKMFLSVVYTYKGENDKALEWIEKAKKNILIGDNFFQDLYGMIALNKHNYPEAIEKFTIALKGKKFLWTLMEPANKYKLYYLRGLAYQESGDLLKAKKDFESALLYNVNYQPAINSIATLEGKIINNRTADKTAPVISILEPTTVTRGLKITTAAKDVMVKGIATDASGIQSVMINGTKIYSNEKNKIQKSILYGITLRY